MGRKDIYAGLRESGRLARYPPPAEAEGRTGATTWAADPARGLIAGGCRPGAGGDREGSIQDAGADGALDGLRR